MDNYRGEITIEIYKPGMAFDDVKIDVDYHIEIEHREWGIKDINMYLIGSTTVECVEIGDAGEEKDISFTVDWSAIEDIDWTGGDNYSPYSATIYLTPDNGVDYKKSSLDFTFVNKNR